MENRDRLLKLDRRYKTYKVLKWVLFVFSIGVAVVPAVWVAFKVAPSVPRIGIKVGVAGIAMFVLALGLIFIMRGLDKRYGRSLPWATTALLWSWILYCMLFSLGKVIRQAEQVSLALAIGVSAAFVLGMASELFRVLEQAVKEDYERLK